MSSNIWLRLAGLSGSTAVAAGAYGAHKFRPSNEYYIKVYERGNNYHLLHSLLLAAATLSRRPALVGGLATAGIGAFSGSCYAAALYEDRSKSFLAPFG